MSDDQLWATYWAAKTRRNRLALMLHYLPLVERVSCHVNVPSSEVRSDLQAAGQFAISDCIGRFDSGFGVKFETYAIPRVRGAMIDELRSTDWVPRSVRTKGRALERALEHLRTSLGREPTETETAAELGIAGVALQKARRQVAAASVVRLDAPAARWQQRTAPIQTLVEMVPAAADGPAEIYDIGETEAEVRRAVEALGDHHRAVIRRYYFGGESLTEIGHTLGVSMSRVSQIKADALRDLRAHGHLRDHLAA